MHEASHYVSLLLLPLRRIYAVPAVRNTLSRKPHICPGNPRAGVLCPPLPYLTGLCYPHRVPRSSTPPTPAPQSMDEQCGELVRDLICVVAMKLQGSLVALLLRKTSGDKGPAIVQVGAREGVSA